MHPTITPHYHWRPSCFTLFVAKAVHPPSGDYWPASGFRCCGSGGKTQAIVEEAHMCLVMRMTMLELSSWIFTPGAASWNECIIICTALRLQEHVLDHTDLMMNVQWMVNQPQWKSTRGRNSEIEGNGSSWGALREIVKCLYFIPWRATHLWHFLFEFCKIKITKSKWYMYKSKIFVKSPVPLPIFRVFSGSLGSRSLWPLGSLDLVVLALCSCLEFVYWFLVLPSASACICCGEPSPTRVCRQAVSWWLGL